MVLIMYSFTSGINHSLIYDYDLYHNHHYQIMIFIPEIVGHYLIKHLV